MLFLNPEVGQAPQVVAGLVGAYAGIGAAATAFLTLPFLWRNSQRVVLFLPWAVCLVLIAATFFLAIHASRWGLYFPAQVNGRLLQATMIAGAGALVVFYTALLHTLHKRPYSHRSASLVAVTAVVVVAASVALRPNLSIQPPDNQSQRVSAATDLPLVVVGIDGLTREALLPLVEQGSMPVLSRWMDEGVVAPITTLKPPQEDALWSTVATGVWPFRHGIRSGAVYQPSLGPRVDLRLIPEWILFELWGVRHGSAPLQPSALRRRPLWSLCEDSERSTTVIGWPTRDQPTSAAELAALDDAPCTFVRVRDLVPPSRSAFGAFIATQQGDNRTEILEASASLVDAYHDLDRALASWATTLPEPRVTAVVSVHGYAPQPRWQRFLSNLRGDSSGRGTARGGHDGVLILHGPGIRRQQQLGAIRLVDVMPTLAHAVGFSVAADLDGEVVTRAFDPQALAERPLSFVRTYEGVRLGEAND